MPALYESPSTRDYSMKSSLNLLATYRDSKYRNPNGTMTMAAIRARAPYAKRNILLGTVMLSFCAFCYYWAYSSFAPDDFADVPVPKLSDEELKKLKDKYGLDR